MQSFLDDHEEMVALVGGSRSSRIRQELDPWIGRMVDYEEMDSLLASTRSARIRCQLRPFLIKIIEEPSFSPPTRSRPQTAETALGKPVDIPSVVLAGCRGTGKRRLLGALTCNDKDGLYKVELKATPCVLETKYYSVRVQYIPLELDTCPSLAAETKELLSTAPAVVLLFDLARPETFMSFKDVLPPPPSDGLGDDDLREDEGPDRVLLCVAVDGSAEGESRPEADAAEGEARVWCAHHGYEFLRCSFGANDLESIIARRRSAREGIFGGLLEEDTDSRPLRILEALECSGSWPDLVRRTCSVETRVQMELEGQNGLLPELFFVGLHGSGHSDIACAISTSCSSGSMPAHGVRMSLETKYYRADILIRALDFVLEKQNDCINLIRASGLVLTCDAAQERSFEETCKLFDEAQLSERMLNCGLKLFVMFNRGAVLESKRRIEEQSALWCAERGFELMSCNLTAPCLEALSARWRSGGAGTPLLSSQMGDVGTDAVRDAERIVEALQCYAWPGAEIKGENSLSPQVVGSTADTGSQAGVARIEEATANGSDAKVDDMDKFAVEMKQVREMGDDRERRERACDVAMKLAAAFGVDSDSD